MKSVVLSLLRISLVVALFAASVAHGKNLIADPQFVEVDFESPHYQRATELGFKWLRHQVRLPSEAEKSGSEITLKGGVTFLHSARFAVVPGTEYKAVVTVKGKGKVRLELLWWGKGVTTHRSIAVETTEIDTTAPETISGVVTAPDNAAEAYLRIAVEDGSVTVSAPEVVAK